MSVSLDINENDFNPFEDSEQPHAHEFGFPIGADPTDCACGAAFYDYEPELLIERNAANEA